MWYTLHTGRELSLHVWQKLKKDQYNLHTTLDVVHNTHWALEAHIPVVGESVLTKCVSKLESNVQYIHIYSGTCPLCFLQCSIQACSTSKWSNSDSLSSYLWHFFFNEETRQDKSKSRSRSPSVWSTFWPTEHPSPCFWNASGQTSISWFFCVCLSFPEYYFVLGGGTLLLRGGSFIMWGEKTSTKPKLWVTSQKVTPIGKYLPHALRFLSNDFDFMF
jgi:hypothetical protein